MMRRLKEEILHADLVVAGGGLAGTCCAITAARQGIRVILVQDRPILGGNASSEIRLWILGATSHMGNNNRWAREGGVIDEILCENLWRNPEGNPIILDSILLEMVVAEPNIRLLLNTAVDSVEMDEALQQITSARAFCSQNQTVYQLTAPLFCDASGDGILGFLAGAAFRMGAESAEEFGEGMAPPRATGDMLGHSLYFYSRDTGRPVHFIPPAFALTDISTLLRFREIRLSDTGCKLWWLEYGGNLDTVTQTEEIKWELWRIAYGVWNHIKNSGEFPDAENLTLEWMGTIPGKRESRRFEGDYILIQQDIVEQRIHKDAVSFGGWAIDLHPPEGVYSFEPACSQWHSRGVYQIPYRCMYSRNVHNLFLAGRLISTSHIAFGSTRVMATCAHNGQAIGVAAALCCEHQRLPAALAEKPLLEQLQQRLLRSGQYIPHLPTVDPCDIAPQASIETTSTRTIDEFPSNGKFIVLETPQAMLLPLQAGRVPVFTLVADVDRTAELTAKLMGPAKEGNYTTDILHARLHCKLELGKNQQIRLDFETSLEAAGYVFLVLQPAPGVWLHLTDERLTGVLRLVQGMNAAVAKTSIQAPPPDSGVDTFAFWLPERRPDGQNLALSVEPPIPAFRAEQAINGINRPWLHTNAWVADRDDPRPTLTLQWKEERAVQKLQLSFDTDFDHPMESVLMTHPERVSPHCIKSFRILTDSGQCIFETKNNHQTRRTITLDAPVFTTTLAVEVLETYGAPAAIFGVACFAEAQTP